MTKAQRAKFAIYRELGYELSGMTLGQLAVSRPIKSGRPGRCYQLIDPDGRTTRTIVRYAEPGS